MTNHSSGSLDDSSVNWECEPCMGCTESFVSVIIQKLIYIVEELSSLFTNFCDRFYFSLTIFQNGTFEYFLNHFCFFSEGCSFEQFNKRINVTVNCVLRFSLRKNFKGI